MSIRLTAAASLTCVAATMLFATSCFGAPTRAFAGVSVRPAHFDSAVPATRAYFVRAVGPRGSFRDAVVVSNSNPRPVHLLAYPVDGLTGVTSGTVYANRRDPRRTASRWVSMMTGMIDVPAHRSVSVPFTIRVPAGAMPGDHVAGIAFENPASIRSAGHFSVRLITRQVVGVEIQVAGPARSQIVLRSISVRSLPGTAQASAVVTLANVGQKLCKPVLRVGLASGGPARLATRRLDTLLPGAQIPYPLPWPSTLVAGTYRAIARVTHCGAPATLRTIVHLGRQLSGSDAAPSVSGLRPAGASSKTPWWALIGVALGGLSVGLVARRRSGSHPIT